MSETSTDFLRRGRAGIGGGLLGFWLLSAFACWPSSRNDREPDAGEARNVILISIDSLRADHLGSYGYSRDTSPAIDALASEGVLFERGIAQAPWTLPSHASLLTSLYSRTHQTNDPKRRLPPEVATLASAFRNAGYVSHAVVSGTFMQSRFGMDAGFDTYDDALARVEHRESHAAVTSPYTHARAVRFLDSAEPPFFLFLHYWDVHYDYIPPPPFDTKFDPDYEGGVSARGYIWNPEIQSGMDPRDREHLIALYDGEIAWVDEHIGMLIAALKERDLYDDTIIALTADHGDEFFEHGEKGHQHSLYQELLHVPLIIRIPGAGGGRRIEERVGLIDVMPTLLEAAGVPVPPGLQGRSLLPLIRGEAWRARPVFAETTKARKSRKDKRKSDSWTVYVGRHKLTLFSERRYPDELYDLEADPGEQHDLAGAMPDGELRAAYQEWLESVPLAIGATHEGLDEETERALQALGYTGR